MRIVLPAALLAAWIWLVADAAERNLKECRKLGFSEGVECGSCAELEALVGLDEGAAQKFGPPRGHSRSELHALAVQ